MGVTQRGSARLQASQVLSFRAEAEYIPAREVPPLQECVGIRVAQIRNDIALLLPRIGFVMIAGFAPPVAEMIVCQHVDLFEPFHTLVQVAARHNETYGTAVLSCQ